MNRKLTDALKTWLQRPLNFSLVVFVLLLLLAANLAAAAHADYLATQMFRLLRGDGL